MKDVLALTLTCALLVGVILLSCHVWASQPIVEVSASTGEVVRIIGSDTMPDKYQTVWVK